MPSTGDMIWEKAPFGFGSDGVFGSFTFARIPCSLLQGDQPLHKATA